MPQVPTLDTFQVAPTGLPNVQQQAPENAVRMAAAANAGNEQVTNLNDAATGGLNTANAIQNDVQDMANKVRVQDATNQLRQSALNLQFDPQTGYAQQKGQQALQRDSGVPLSVEYGQKLQSTAGDIGNALGNDAQKRAFYAQAGEVQTAFQQGVQSHVQQQFQEYTQSVAKGAVDIAANTAALNYTNPDAVDQAVQQAKTGVMTMMQGLPSSGAPGDQGGQGGAGASANATQNMLDMTESAIRSKVIDTALENNNPTYALSYFNKYKSNMVADDILKVQGKLNQQVDQHVALSAVQATAQDNLHLLAPTPTDRAFNLATGGDIGKVFGVAIGTESAGQQFGTDGQPLTSAKGATGIAQVMPSTGPEAAQLAGVPWDENKFANDANYNYKLGLAYFTQQIKTFGGVDKAFAAYNAGPQATKDAVAQATTDGKPAMWLSYLPKETQDYVTKNTQQLQTGGGVPVVPTKAAFVAQALSPAIIGDNPRPSVVSLIQDKAEKQYDLMIASRNQQGEQSMATAQRALDQNGGDMTQLPPQMVADVTQYAPDKLGDLYKYAKSISSPAMATNVGAYADAVAHPEKLATMSDADFTNYLKTNFSPGRDQDHIAMLRGDVINGTRNDSAQSINTGAMNTSLNQRFAAIGMAPNPKAGTDDATQNAVVRKFVADDIYQQQSQLGRKMTPEEVSGRIDTLFANKAVTDGWWQSTPKTMLAMTPSNIPDADMDQVTGALAKRGITSPTDEQILRTYWNWKK